LFVWTGAALSEQPITLFSATPGKPVIADKWADVPKLYPKGWPGRWDGEVCSETQLLDDMPVEFHRLSHGPVVAIIPCLGGFELWVGKGNFKVVPLPMPSRSPEGGFTVRRSAGLFAWNADSSAFTVTTGSDLVPHMQQRLTYAIGSSVQTISLIKVESALYSGRSNKDLEWQTEWEARPWRAEPKGPLLNP
jgi:hypothetical protein